MPRGGRSEQAFGVGQLCTSANMAFVAVPAGVTPRFRRDSLRRVTASRVVAARPGTGSVRRASIRAAAPQQVSAEELEEILKESNVPLCMFPCILTGPDTVGQRNAS
jgi:hypothetical protein